MHLEHFKKFYSSISEERAGDLFCLIKLRLGLLVLFATAAGFCMGSPQGIEGGRLAFTLLGTGLVSGGAAVLNQLLEIRWDRLMARTRNRPLPGGRVPGPTAFTLGIGMSIGGGVCLAWKTTALATCFAIAAWVVYLAVYTPLKRRSSVCRLVGALAGAMPPVIGWAAADGSLGWGTGVLFGVLFTWQIPHLLSIAWLHREDYANAGFAVLSVDDSSGRATALQSLAFSGLLTGITLIPVFMGAAGAVYLLGTLLLDAVLLLFAGLFLRERSREAARRLFGISIAYLPAFFALIILTRR